MGGRVPINGATCADYFVRLQSVPLMLSQSGFRSGSSIAVRLMVCSSMSATTYLLRRFDGHGKDAKTSGRNLTTHALASR